jgi:prolipoprotein diacylglyceryltransferase
MLFAPIPASLPSPDVAVWHLGPLPIRAYALCLLTGIVVAGLAHRPAAAGARGRGGEGH